jgi:TP901 family phage tail tape measure protein
MAEKIIVQYELDTKQFKAQIDQINKRLNEIESSGKKATNETKKGLNDAGNSADNFNNKLKNTGSSFESLGGLVKKAGAAFAGLFAAEKIISIFKGAVETIKEFDQSVQDLSAITGASGADLDKYKQAAIQMGAGVQGGAAATVEAFKLIGSAKPELLANADALIGVTEAAITLSKAAGMDLPSAATALTDALNQFGAPAEEAGRYINVLAAGSKFGAVEIPNVTEALLKFGAAAKTSNVSIEESTALIEALGEKGLKGAEAGTAIRNVLLKIGSPDALPKDAQQALEGLGISFDDLTDKQKPLAERFETLKPLLNDQAALIKVFGTENAIAATNILQNTDRLRELTSQVSGTNTAYEQAEVRSKTLNEALNRLKETYNGIILGFADSGDASGKFAGAIDVVSNNMDDLIDMFMRINKPIIDIYKSIGELIAAFDTGEESAVKVSDGLALLEIAIKYVTLPIRLFYFAFKEMIDLFTDGVKWFQETAKESTALGNTLRVVGETARTVFEAMKDLFGVNPKGLNMAERAALDYAYAQEKVNIALAKGKDGEAEMDAIYKKVASQINITREQFDAYVKKKQEEKKVTEEVNEENKKAIPYYQQLQAELTAITARITDVQLKGGIVKKEDIDRAQRLNGLLTSVSANTAELVKAATGIKFDLDIVGLEDFGTKLENFFKSNNEKAAAQYSIDQQKYEEGLKAKEKLFEQFNLMQLESGEVRVKTEQDLLDEELAALKRQLDAKYISEEAYYAALGVLQGKQKDLNKKVFDEQLAQAQTVLSAIGNAINDIGALINQAYDLQQQKINDTLQVQINAINKSTLSEEQKKAKIEALQKKAAKDEYELQVKAFKVNQGLQIANAAISTAQAVVAGLAAGLAAGGPAGIALGPITAALAGAVGAVQIGLIAAQQPPAPPSFAKGTDSVQLGNNKPGIDTIPAYLNEGEAVIPTDKNKKYPGLSKAWISGNLDDYIVRQFVAPKIAEIEKKAEEKWMQKFTANFNGEKFDDMNLLRATTEGNMYLRTIAKEIKNRPQKRTVN